MRSTLALLVAIALPSFGAAQSRPTVTTPRTALAEPGISPDGREIAFVAGADIWVVPMTGGEARLLVSHSAAESRPLYSPDGKRVAFVSTRAGSADIWVLDLASGDVRRLTFDDGNEQLDAWSRDGKWIYFSTSAHDISGMADEYRVSADGGTPMPVAADRYAAEFMGSPSPDGSVTAIVARGNAQSQWWRKGRSHLDESELWLVSGDNTPTYRQLTPLGAKQQWPMWSADGHTLYFVSDRNGPQNVWSLAVGGSASAQPNAITTFTDGRVLFPTITRDGRTIAFERDFGIWTLDVASGATRRLSVTLVGANATAAAEHLTLTNNFSDMALSPDGKKIAFVARGDVFATAAAQGGDAERVTHTPAIEQMVTWAPDSRRIAYVANRDGAWHVYAYDFGTRTEAQLTRGAANDLSPRFSPDGKQLAYFHDARELRVLDLGGSASSEGRLLGRGYLGRPPTTLFERPIAWSPDGKWIAYLAGGTKLFVNANVVSVAGGESHQVSFIADTRANSISWSADGTYLLLDAGQRGEAGIVARVDLVPRTPRFREDQLAALFRDDTPGRTTPVTPPLAPPTPQPEATPSGAPAARDPRTTRVVFDNIRDRLSVLPVGVDVTSQEISPDGKQLLLVASAAGQASLYTYSLDDLATDAPVARQLTTTPGQKRLAQWAPDSKSVYFLEQGRIVNIPLDTRTPRAVAARAELDVDFSSEKMTVFNQAWEFLNDNFYDPNFHGTNWPAVREQYAPLIAGSRSPDDMRRLLSLMIGEMNGSHMGISGPREGPAAETGRIGLTFERGPYEARGEMRVAEVIPLSPAALTDRIKPGDYLLAVDGVAMGAHVTLDSLLGFKVGKKVTLTIASSPSGADKRDVSVLPTNTGTEKTLLYRAWTASRRAYVEKASGGRLGYVHMLDMGAGAIDRLNLDLDSDNHAREGIVLDIRNNNGGFVNGHALDELQRSPYILMVRRGVPAVPARPVLGQRALEAPTVLVTNQHTLSDGENFTEGYRTMKLGKVVGEPTAGWDVYTSGGTMVDGTTVRLPFMTNAQLDGTPLELKPRAVDVAVERRMGESYEGKDTQLDAAVKELLSRLGPAPARRATPGGR